MARTVPRGRWRRQATPSKARRAPRNPRFEPGLASGSAARTGGRLRPRSGRRELRGVHSSAALIAGLVAGFAIAAQIGAVSLLVIDTAISGGPQLGIAAGAGVATVDLCFGAVAALAGGAATAALSSTRQPLQVTGAIVLGAVAVRGLWRERRTGDLAREAHVAGTTAATVYRRFVGLTLANPLTIVSFVAVASALSFASAAAALAFTVGIGAASGGWHAALALVAGHAGRRLSPRARRGLAVAGRVAVLGIAVDLALR